MEHFPTLEIFPVVWVTAQNSVIDVFDAFLANCEAAYDAETDRAVFQMSIADDPFLGSTSVIQCSTVLAVKEGLCVQINAAIIASLH